MRRVCLALLVIICLPGAARADKRPLVPADYYKEAAASEVAVAPNGAMVAFTVTTVLEKENKRHREIWMVRLKGGAPDGAAFRFTDPTEDSSSPRWSTDSSLLAFTSRRGKDRNSTWFARVTAPGGEAFHVPGVEGAPTWSPDGAWIAFTKAPGTDEGADGEDKKRDGWIAPDAISKTLDAKRFDGRVVTSMRYKRDGTLDLLPHYSTRRKAQLFVVSAGGGTARQVTTLPVDVGGVEWSRDGRFVYFTADERQDDEYNDEPTSDIYLVARDGGDPRKLTANPGGERSVAVAPRGDRMAFLFTKARGAETDLMVVDLGPDGSFAGVPRSLTAAWDDQPGAPWWTPDGSAVRFSAGLTGNQHVFEASLAGAVRQVTTGDRSLGSVDRSADGSVMAYDASDPVSPPEVYVSAADGRGERRVTSFNDAWLADVTLTRPERLAWKVADGTTIEGWLVKPAGYAPGTRYPMILKIHGGPHGAYGNIWFDQFQMLSGSGFFVLYTNPRGSTGYGHRYTYATRAKWGEVDKEDYLLGVDTALAKYPDIDPKRVGISGGSYGGFMTCWLTATTDRFAAAVAARIIVNWESWYGASDAQGLTEYEFNGPPWDGREVYRRLSPISYVERVKAPTLVLEGENDYRTPMAEGEQWFMALKKRKVPTELVRYPRSSHGLSRTGEPWLLVDRLERIRTWFVYWLIDHPAAGAATR